MEVEVKDISCLSRDLIIDILSRLPAKVLCKFRCVSNQWLNLISDPYFKNLHRNRSRRNPLLLFWRSIAEDREELSFQLHTMDTKGTVHTEFNSVDDTIIRLISCSGLVFLYCFNHIYICNPSINDEVVKVLDNSPSPRNVIYGFGFLPSRNEYKIIRLILPKTKSGIFIDGYEIPCEIYTLQDGGIVSCCRSVEVNWPCKIGCKNPSVCVNGVLYWLIYQYNVERSKALNIMSFDLEKEEFGTVEVPVGYGYRFNDTRLLVELNGVLCFVVSFERTPTIDIWVLKDNHEKSCVWEKEYTINFSTLDGFHVVTEFEWPRSIIPLDIQNGEILIEQKAGSFYYYNIENKSFRKAGFSKSQKDCTLCIFFESFFSLGSGRSQLFSEC